jgi:hypothetical protein
VDRVRNSSAAKNLTKNIVHGLRRTKAKPMKMILTL